MCSELTDFNFLSPCSVVILYPRREFPLAYPDFTPPAAAPLLTVVMKKVALLSYGEIKGYVPIAEPWDIRLSVIKAT